MPEHTLPLAALVDLLFVGVLERTSLKLLNARSHLLFNETCSDLCIYMKSIAKRTRTISSQTLCKHFHIRLSGKKKQFFSCNEKVRFIRRLMKRSKAAASHGSYEGSAEEVRHLPTQRTGSGVPPWGTR